MTTSDGAEAIPTSPCRVWRDGSREAAVNMAADEWLLHQAETGEQAWLRAYGWTGRAITFGYFQPHDVAPPGFEAIRRPTGGGVVYHLNDFTFTIAVPRRHPLFQVDRFASYRLVNDAVRAVAEGLGVGAELAAEAAEVPDRHRLECFVSPAKFDVLTDHGKLCGGAQRRTREGMLVQNSIDLAQLPGIGRERLADALIPALSRLLGTGDGLAFEPSADDLAAIRLLAEDRYATTAWNHRR